MGFTLESMPTPEHRDVLVVVSTLRSRQTSQRRCGPHVLPGRWFTGLLTLAGEILPVFISLRLAGNIAIYTGQATSSVNKAHPLNAPVYVNVVKSPLKRPSTCHRKCQC